MKILSSDFDDTLYFHELGGYKKEDIIAIKQFQKKGNKFGLCTGRSMDTIPIKEDIHFDYFITNTGASIYDGNKNLLFEKTIKNTIFKEIYNIYQNESILFVCGLHTYQGKHLLFDAGLKKIDNMDDFIDDINSMSIHFTDINMTNKAIEYFKRYDCIDVYRNHTFLDLVPKGCSKASGIEFIEKYYHVSNTESYGIGDNYNDISMLEYCHISFGFPYSPKEVKDYCDFIVNSIKEALEVIDETISM
ncbi:MAG: HAD-IIB family hydrolase [Holdemanella sp.]|nr:HAD-IIB family hydrolase [Holdemanella sp.]